MMAKRKLTPAEKARKRARKAEFMTIFINGKQKQVRRPPTIDGMDVDEFIRQNADPIWLHQNEMWEYIEAEPSEGIDDGDVVDIF
jgi:16S rRNA U516 pseudouridylate synthase RsuA-like enzyme